MNKTASPHPVFARTPMRSLFTLSREKRVDLLIALGFAVLWWGAAMLLQPTGLVHVLTDQTGIFMPAGASVANPYLVESFFNPPWAAVLLAPFSWIPFPLAMLLQLMLYFVLVTLVLHKFGGERHAVVLTLTSFVALNSALELNVEWMVCLGLLLPVRWSLPFLLIKPQTAFGYYLGVPWRDLVRAVSIGLIFGVFALLIWGPILPDLLNRVQNATRLQPSYNAAPMVLLGTPLSLLIGIVLAMMAFRKRDPALSILAWMFFVPYLALYGLLLHLGLFAIRAPRAALVTTLVIWVIFGGMLGSHLLNAMR